VADAGEFEADTLRQGSGDMMPALWDRIVGELGRRETRVMFGAEAAPILLDRFEVRRCVGVGGMGVVFEAFDPDLRRRVALKICKTRVVEARAIEHEARCLAKLSHPNIVAVHEIVRLGADLILVMEFVEGQTLRKWQATTRPDWRELLSRYLDAGQALAAVHAAGLEHGDFKPDNVMVDSSGRVRVVDFGIARYSVESNDAGELAKAGTRAYMAPERIMGKPGGSKADIYAFCVAVWESLHGVRPYAGATEHALLEAILAGKPTRGRATLGMPGRVREVLMKGMAAQPSDRYANMEALLRALHDQVDGRRRLATRLRQGVLLGSVVVLLVASLAMAVALRLGSNRPPDLGAIEQTLVLAANEARQGDPVAAVQYLEVARWRAHRDNDALALRKVAAQAERLGDVLMVRGEETNAGLSWDVAYEIFVELQDEEAIERLTRMFASRARR